MLLVVSGFVHLPFTPRATTRHHEAWGCRWDRWGETYGQPLWSCNSRTVPGWTSEGSVLSSRSTVMLKSYTFFTSWSGTSSSGPCRLTFGGRTQEPLPRKTNKLECHSTFVRLSMNDICNIRRGWHGTSV